ncbi:MAG: sugar ABC transporter substrate-binding protein [Blautia sp.]|nr:sugar ABC transporter substrate-binding protein [Blautia sp.]
MSRTKVMSIILAAAMACSMLAVNVTAVHAEEPVTINFLCDNRSEFETLKEILPEFTEATGIDVNFTYLQETQLRSKTGLELQADSTDIDVMLMDFLYLPTYVNAGYIEPLDDYFAGSETYKEEDFIPAFIDACKGEDGKLYAVPLYQDCSIMVLRGDIFEELGLAIPKTFAELEEACKTISESKDMAAIAMRGARGMGVCEWTFPSFLAGFGGSYYTEDMKANFESEEAINALTYYSDLLTNYGPAGVANYSYTEVQNDLMQGTAAIMIDSATLAVRAEDPEASTVAGKLAYAPLPSDGEHDPQPGFYSWDLVVPKGSANKEAAAKLIEWIISPDISTRLGFSAPNQALQGVYAIPAYEGLEGAYSLYDCMEASLALADPDFRPRIPEELEVGEFLSIAVSDVLAGTSSVEDALKSCNEQTQQVLDDAGY